LLPALHGGAATGGPPGEAQAAQIVGTPGELSCLDLGRHFGRVVRQYQWEDQRQVEAWKRGDSGAEHRARMDEMHSAMEAAQEHMLRIRPISAADILAKLVAALSRVNEAKDNIEIEPCDEAADAIRQCLVALSAITGVTLLELAADYVDHELHVALDGSAPA
jgi:hypothetical protein